jgi:hypothetical protein
MTSLLDVFASDFSPFNSHTLALQALESKLENTGDVVVEDDE